MPDFHINKQENDQPHLIEVLTQMITKPIFLIVLSCYLTVIGSSYVLY